MVDWNPEFSLEKVKLSFWRTRWIVKYRTDRTKEDWRPIGAMLPDEETAKAVMRSVRSIDAASWNAGYDCHVRQSNEEREKIEKVFRTLHANAMAEGAAPVFA